MQKLEINSQKTGFYFGIILPVIALLAFYFFRYRAIPIAEFFRFVYFREILSPLVSLTVLPNLLLFFIFIRSNFLQGARGVLLATIVLAVAVVIIKAIS
jgi:hypothetical protein